MKIFNVQDGIGKARYVINFHDGIKCHKDGSAFFDVVVFRNKKSRALYLSELHKLGYVEARE